MKRLHLSLFTALVCLFASTSYAMPMVSSSGVTGLEVDGVFYDIAIGDMGGITTAEAFAGLGLTETVDPARAAVNSVLALFLNSQPSTIRSMFFEGCVSSLACSLVSPTHTRTTPTGGTRYNGTVQSVLGTDWIWAASELLSFQVASAMDSVTYAVVSRATTVPAPATLALFGLGLAGLGWSRRKQHS